MKKNHKTLWWVLGIGAGMVCLTLACLVFILGAANVNEETGIYHTETVAVESGFPYGEATIMIHEMQWSEYFGGYRCLSGNRVPSGSITVSCPAEAESRCAFEMWVAVGHQDGMWGSEYSKDEDTNWNPLQVDLAAGEQRTYGFGAGRCMNPSNQPTNLSLRIVDPTGSQPDQKFYCPFEEPTPEAIHTLGPEPTTAPLP